MSDEPMTNNLEGWWRRWPAWIGLAVLLYPLPIGPATRFYVLTHRTWYHDVFGDVYSPFFKCAQAKSFGKPLATYISSWLPESAHADEDVRAGSI